MPKRSAVSFILALGIAIAGSFTIGSSQPRTFELNAILSLTGPQASVGESFRDGLLAAEATINKEGGIRGTPVHMNILDDVSDAATSVQLANQLTAKHVAVIIGPGVASTCRATMPILADHGPVDYCLSPAIIPPANSYVFASSASAYDIIRVLYHYARERGWKRMATITSTDATGQIIDQATAGIMKLPEFADTTIVDAEHFNPDALTVDAEMSRIKAAQPQVVFGWTTGTPFGTVMRSATQIVPNLPIVTQVGNTPRILNQFSSVLPKELYEQVAPFMVGVAGNARAKAAGEAMLEAMHRSPNALAVQAGWAWDAAMLVRAAYNARGLDATADQIHSFILSQKDFAGACGIYDFTDGNQRGLGFKDQVIVRWDGAKHVWIPVSDLGGKPL